MEQDAFRLNLPTEYNSDGTKVPRTAKSNVPDPKHETVGQPESTPRITVIPCDPLVSVTLNQYEKDFLGNSDPSKYAGLRFVEPFGSIYNGSAFNDALDLVGGATQAEDWPSRVEVDCTKEEGSVMLTRFRFVYSNGWSVGHPAARSSSRAVTSQLNEDLKGAKIVRVKVEKRLRWIAFKLSNSKNLSAGLCPDDAEVWTFDLPEGCQGLKGFWGRESDKLERLGLIWG